MNSVNIAALVLRLAVGGVLCHRRARRRRLVT
jgi:hypothetical protein